MLLLLLRYDPSSSGTEAHLFSNLQSRFSEGLNASAFLTPDMVLNVRHC